MLTSQIFLLYRFVFHVLIFCKLRPSVINLDSCNSLSYRPTRGLNKVSVTVTHLYCISILQTLGQCYVLY